MQVWNVLHTACWKYSTQKIAKKSPSGHHPRNLSGYIFAIKARINNRKNLLISISPHMSPQYGELRPTSGWDRSGSLGTPANVNGFCVLAALLHGTRVLGVSHTLRRSNRGRHLYSAGRPSRWALAHILVSYVLMCACRILIKVYRGIEASLN